MKSTDASVWFQPDEAGRFLPEGPRLLPNGDAVWINIQTGAEAKAGQLFVGGQPRELPGRIGFVLPTDCEGVLFAGIEKSVGFLHGGHWQPLATIPDRNPRTIINDAEIVPGGDAVVFGTKDTKFSDPLAHLYLFTVADRTITVLRDGQICSNGKVFARDDRGTLLFDIDTPTKTLARYRLDLEERTLVPDGIAVDLRHESAFPDGMCDCGDGTVIVAFYNPDMAEYGRAVRYRLDDGTAVEEWRTPASPRVTCPLLVPRPDGVKLILSTATEGMPPEMRARCPNAGCLFLADTSFASVPAVETVRLATRLR